MAKQNPHIKYHKPTRVIQRIETSKREVVLTTRDDDTNGDDLNAVNESEEFDSDEHVENDSDWYDELNVIQMPHLLGPSATKYSPIPVEHQHLSTFLASPPGCYQISIQCKQQ